MLAAGKLNKRITIEQAVETPDAYGQPIIDWQVFRRCWAAIEPVSGREAIVAQQVQAAQAVLIRMRYHKGITPKMRVTWNGRTFGIGAVINVDEANQETQLTCTELVAT